MAEEDTGRTGVPAVALLAAALMLLPATTADASCSAGNRVDYRDAECLSAWWKNRGLLKKSPFHVRNMCPEYGKVVAKVDLKSAMDRTLHLNDGLPRDGDIRHRISDSRASTRRRQLEEPMRLVPSARPPRGGGAARRAHCTEARHGTVRTHPLQVCLASPDEAPIRSAYGRHPPRPATVGPGADVRDVTGEVRQQEAGKEWTAKRYTAVRRGVGAGGKVRGLSGAAAPGRSRWSARWRCAPQRSSRRVPCTRRSARRCLRHTAAGPCGAAITPLLRRTGSRRLRAHAPRAWIRPALAFFSGSGWRQWSRSGTR